MNYFLLISFEQSVLLEMSKKKESNIAIRIYISHLCLSKIVEENKSVVMVAFVLQLLSSLLLLSYNKLAYQVKSYIKHQLLYLYILLITTSPNIRYIKYQICYKMIIKIIIIIMVLIMLHECRTSWDRNWNYTFPPLKQFSFMQIKIYRIDIITTVVSGIVTLVYHYTIPFRKECRIGGLSKLRFLQK